MRKRSTEILQSIIRSRKQNFTVKELALKYDVSQKTLQNDIKEINQLLRNIPMSEITVNSKGELEKPKDFCDTVVKEYLNNMDLYMYKLSTEERQMYIMVILTVSQKYMAMKQFADELGVSRVTIVNDMENIKEKFAVYGSHLVLDPGKGMYFDSDEKTKIEILTDLYRDLSLNHINDGFFQRILLKRVQVRYSFSEIFTHIQEYMKVNQMVFTDDSCYDIVLYMFVVFNFCQKNGRTIHHEDKLTSIDHLILYAGVMLNVNVTKGMVEQFREYMEEHKLHAFVKTLDEIELYKIIVQFVNAVDEELNMNLSSDNKLLDSLLMHIRNMKDWGSYEIELPSEYDSYLNYEMLQTLVEKNAYILEDFLSYSLSPNMVKSIVIHICVAVIRNRRYVNRFSVVIVCPGSMATGKYLEAQIKNYFDFHIIGVWAAGEVIRRLEEEKIEVDYIISTVPIKTEKYHVIQVHPFLQMEDMNRIQKTIFQKQKMEMGPLNPLKNKLLVIKNMIQDVFDDKTLAMLLCNKVEEIVNDYEQKVREERKNPVEKLLREEYIQIQEDGMEWREAIYKAGVPLIKSGLIEPRYLDKSIESVEEFGSYIVLGSGVALAHAKKEYGVHKDCLSLLVSSRGIVFPDVDEKVKLLFVFASTGQDDHLETLKEIIQIGRDTRRSDYISRLRNEREIYEAITNVPLK